VGYIAGHRNIPTAETVGHPPMVDSGRITNLKTSQYDDIAYVTFDLILIDQEIILAMEYLKYFEARIHDSSPEGIVFICHASEDKEIVDRIVAVLNSLAMGVWYDKQAILVGDSIVEEINKGLDEAKYVIAVLSKASVQKPWVKRELSASLARQLDENNVRILPILLDDCEIPKLMRDIRYADFRNDFNHGITELIRSIWA